MSLLPGQILPQSASLGTLNSDGTVTIDKNWYLLLYNMAQQVLGLNGGLNTAQLIDLQNIDIDASGADPAALRTPISSLATQIPTEPDAVPYADIRNALLLGVNSIDSVDVAWAKTSGFGTPTGASVVANFSGTAATNAQMQATIAQILVILKANGLVGA